jgi:hypothetical protein
MDEKKRMYERDKNPAIAAILSIFPGVGLFYVGNILKGVAYILIFTALIILQVNAWGNEHIIYGLLIAGFYIFQIFDSYNEARKITYEEATDSELEKKPTLFMAITIVVLGIIFQLAELDIISYRKVAKLWPIILIVVGAKVIFEYFYQQEEGNEK